MSCLPSWRPLVVTVVSLCLSVGKRLGGGPQGAARISSMQVCVVASLNLCLVGYDVRARCWISGHHTCCDGGFGCGFVASLLCVCARAARAHVPCSPQNGNIQLRNMATPDFSIVGLVSGVHSKYITCMVPIPLGAYFLSADHDGNIYIWQLT